jgi:chlorite dismutase
MAEPTIRESESGGKTAWADPVGQIDLSEKGRTETGQAQALDRRLFMQFLAFADCRDKSKIVQQVVAARLNVVLYEDLGDPRGIGLLAFSEQPDYFLDQVHPLLQSGAFSSLQFKPELAMLGRTYTLGYESDLEDVLIRRPIERVCNPKTPWAVWYPVRRSGSFEWQSREDQRKMLMEHGGIGQAYGKGGFATDIRLACHGLGREDNDFVVGLLGKELFPLSALIQHMRHTRQTSEFIERMGPFFVGRALWQATI